MRVLRAGARAGAWTFGGLAVLLAVLLSPTVVDRGDDLPIEWWSAVGWYLVVLVGLVLPISLIVAVARGAGQVVLEEQQRARTAPEEPPA